jgi:hypothetical protein
MTTESNKEFFDNVQQSARQTNGNSSSPINRELKIDDSRGPSSHIATDKWSKDDYLGYEAYAYAIARFLTHKETKSPLSISIQAPWGGGKTSLMRMVRARIDKYPDFLENKEKGGAIQNEGQFKAKVRDILNLINKANKDNGNDKDDKFKIYPPDEGPDPKYNDEEMEARVTIWFNAWRYESTSQLWSGLADSIVNQIVQRLKNPEDREKFLFRLHLRRQNVDKIRQKIYDQILSRWWEKTRPWVMAFVLATMLSIALSVITVLSNFPDNNNDPSIKMLGNLLNNTWWVGPSLSVFGATITSIINYFDVRQESAKMIAGEFLDVPDYSNNLGLVHHVEKDLQNIFEVIRATETEEKNISPL